MKRADDPLFDAVLERCLEAIESEGASAVEEACSAHPDFARRLRRRVGLLVAAHLIDLGPSLDRLPGRMGEFELLDRIGAGGMGVVHRARQVRTGRLVALKLVRPEQLLFAGSRARFRREVELSARLHHPAVLDVLAVGETEGLPWFALELVHGTSLAALIGALRARAESTAEIDPARLPHDLLELTPPALRDGASFPAPSSWREWSLAIALRVADAVAYAHRKGVLHRDVKPSNVLLATDGRVFLTDFGLASDPGEATITRSSSAVGSLPYMAPEVLEGQPSDVQSDVYGIGALLYELWTLHRPFEAESTAALVRAIVAGEPIPPRRHAPGLGADEQAVVLRALERDPKRRYASADELREDLAHLLAHEPTRARPLGTLARAVRAARRKPVLAVALGLGSLALLAGPSGWAASRMHALREIEEAYDAELAMRERAERHFRAALAAIGHVLRDTAVDELEDVPRLQAARLVAIERALELVAELERDRPGDDAVRAERAALHSARAGVLYDQGRFEAALDDCARAERVQRELADRGALHTTLDLHARLLEASLRWDEALPIQRELLADLRAIAAQAPDVEARRRVAATLANVASSRQQVEGVRAASEELFEGHALARELQSIAPDDADVVWTLGRLARDRAELELDLGERDAARASAEEALEAFRAAAELNPSSRAYRSETANGLATLAKVGAMRGADVEPLYREALAIFAELSRDFPESVRYRLEQARVLDELAVSLRRTRPADARPLHEQAIALCESLARAQPERCQIRWLAATALNNWANHLIHVDRDGEQARDACERALRVLEGCGADERAGDDLARTRTGIAYLHALALCIADEVERARPELDAHERSAGDDAVRWRYAADLWNEWTLAVRRSRPEGELRAAEEHEGRTRMLAALRRAIELGYRDLAELRRTPALDPFRSDPDFAALLELAERQ